MPHIRISMTAGRTDDQKSELAEIITDAMVRVVGATPRGTIVIFEDVPKQNWSTAGELSSRRKPA
ncbi:tautomerase family protein [Aliihoeflea sp. PC F10.4]